MSAATAERPGSQAMLTTEDLAELFRADRNTILLWAKQGRIPAPIRLTRKHLLWEAEAVRAFLESRLAAGRDGAA